MTQISSKTRCLHKNNNKPLKLTTPDFPNEQGGLGGPALLYTNSRRSSPPAETLLASVSLHWSENIQFPRSHQQQDSLSCVAAVDKRQ